MRLLPGPVMRAALACVLCGSFTSCADAFAEDTMLPTVEVIAPTVLPGIGTPIQATPANVQIMSGKEIANQRQTTLTDYLEQNASGMTINAAQGNPFQPSVNFRGFTASPLLGLPQGLSVYQDGVRINEPFGDVVNWDLIPQSAISNIQIIPGSNPVFGLNTLGGAIAVNTKSGLHNPGGMVETSGGSFGRKVFEIEHGGKAGPWDYFLTGNFFDEDGWADHNPSSVKQFFGKLGYRSAATQIDVALTAADNTLEGAQTIPQSFSNNIRQAYTYPDRNINQLAFLTITASHDVNDVAVLSGNLYYRHQGNRNVSSNINDNFGQPDPVTGTPDPLQATNNQSAINQDSVGFGSQIALQGDLAGKKNQLAVGVTGDFGIVTFTQNAADAAFTADRATVNTSGFVQQTKAQTRNQYGGIYFTDTLMLNEQWNLTMAGRYNVARVQIEDQSGSAAALNGRHTFSRINPALGVNFNPTPSLTFYGSYNEGMRAPTPVELTCADPAAPCKLPNSFVADPPLKKVVSKTVESGGRGKIGNAFSWSAAIYRTELLDDIQFISSNGAAINTGYFQNVGNTRRQGIELSARTSGQPVALMLQYSYLNATYQSAFAERSPNNSSADLSGAIQVHAGNRIPGLPLHNVKLRFDYDRDQRVAVGANINYCGGIYARGDENNRDVHGKVPSYVVVNLDARYKVTKAFQMFARVNNLFDRQYASFGMLGQNFFNGPNNTFDGNTPTTEQFRAMGAPRGAWIGLRYAWM